jgi:hypothetical protein
MSKVDCLHPPPGPPPPASTQKGKKRERERERERERDSFVSASERYILSSSTIKHLDFHFSHYWNKDR